MAVFRSDKENASASVFLDGALRPQDGLDLAKRIREAFTILGNGDLEQGKSLVSSLAARLACARENPAISVAADEAMAWQVTAVALENMSIQLDLMRDLVGVRS